MVEISLLFAIVLFAYPFTVYPVLLRFLARRHAWQSRPLDPAHTVPTVALVICALNEGCVIEDYVIPMSAAN
jgi:hypothetical protein